MSYFKTYKEWINEEASYDNVTVLLPGGFKPMTGAHLSLIKRYAIHPQVENVRVIVGPKTRNGITQEMGIEIAKILTKNIPNVTVEGTNWPSPILTAYKEIENMKPGNYALAASSKGDDYKRVKDFTDQHQPGGKYYEGLPKEVNIVELPVDVQPAVFIDGPHEGKPISASTLRQDIMNGDYSGFASGYPETDDDQIQQVWNLLNGVVTESFNYLMESIVPKVNKHMTHAEDLVVLGGLEGMDWVLNMFRSLYNELRGTTAKSEMKLSVKIDGAPAITAWSEFPTLPKNGIALKGLFAKAPKVFTTPEEIKEGYSDKPDLMYKLLKFLEHLPKINIPKGEIWQGDFLFDNKSLKETEINGEKYWAFHPNTIYYVVPKDSDLGKLIEKAEVGIAWHTRYTGDDLENVSANYNASKSELKLIDEVLMTDVYIKSFAGIINFTEEESIKIDEELYELESIARNFKKDPVYKDIIENTNLILLFNIFQNSLIRTGTKISDPEEMINEFIEFIQNRGAKEAEKMKSEVGKEKKLTVYAELVDDVEQNKDIWFLICHSIITITQLKNIFVKKLSKLGEFQTYLKMKEGDLRGTNQEGFAVSDIDGNIVKLVDRDEFSWANFSPDVQKGWDSPG